MPALRLALPVLLLAAGVVAATAALGTAPRVTAIELLQNGDFASWTPDGPVAWVPLPGGTAEFDSTGNCAMLAGPGASLTQEGLGAEPGASYDARVTVDLGPGATSATLRLAFLDAGLSVIAGGSHAVSTHSSAAPLLLAGSVAPPGTVAFRFAVEMSGDDESTACFAAASLARTTGPPTPTPTSTPTDTSQDPSPSPSPSTTTTTTTTTTASATTTTATGTTTPASTHTPTPGKSPAPTKTPKPPNQGAQPGAAPGTGSGPFLDDGSGGLLVNGGFESIHDGEPVAWSKYGGTLASAEFGAHQGTRAASLLSLTLSTKWLYQAVPVTAGDWYQGTAMAKVSSGKAELFIRMSWYATYDGSGSLMSQVDSTISTSHGWTLLDTGPVQAPAGAKSVRFRLMLRPLEPGAAMFDSAVLLAAAPASPTPTPSPTPSPTAAAQAPATTMTASPAATRIPAAHAPQDSTSANTQPSGPVQPATSTSLRISEVMSDPPEPGNDAPFEWVEIVNIGVDPIITAGWRIGDAQSTDFIPDTVIEPGGHLVVAGSGATFDATVPAVRLPDGRIGNGLNNNGDLVRLLAPDGTLVDEVSYGDNAQVFDPPLPAPAPGHTIGIRDPEHGGSKNWDATREPTPGRPNIFDEEPVVAEAPSPTPHSPTTAPLDPGSPIAGVEQQSTVSVETTRDPGNLPWLILAAAGGAGAMGAAMVGRRAVPMLLRRARRRRGS